MSDKKTGVDLIAEERGRQVNKLGWTPEHDALHQDRQLAIAAMYAIDLNTLYSQDGFEDFEDKIYRKPYKERLIRAGALIAAEIDRLQAAE